MTCAAEGLFPRRSCDRSLSRLYGRSHCYVTYMWLYVMACCGMQWKSATTVVVCTARL